MVRYSFLVRLSHPLLHAGFPGASLITLSAEQDFCDSLTLKYLRGKNIKRAEACMSTPMHIPKGKIVLTYEDYVLLPNDGNRYEILEGELTVTPAPSTKHQTASVNLLVLLSQYIKERDLGKLFHAPIDLILESTSVLQPDLLFVSQARRHIITERAVEGAPDLVVEILSPTTSRTDRVTKAQIYARHGVPVYWIVDPEREAIEIYLLEADGYRLAATLLGKTPMAASPFPELKIAARDVFL
jgi:Uma2 family endonuclease